MSVTLSPPPPLDVARTALFADLDGTLAPIEISPDAVGPDDRRRRLIDDLSSRLGGRLAVISGRALADLDRVLEHRVPSVAAVHGLVRRTAEGATIASPPAAGLAEARGAFCEFARRDDDLLVEEKRWAVALHYRRAPRWADAARSLAAGLARDLGLTLQLGAEVVELRGVGLDKGGAVRAFMAEPPFLGHVPVFIGDDLTDESGFSTVAEMGGYGVIVGDRRPTSASHAVADVTAAHQWLAGGSGPPP